MQNLEFKLKRSLVYMVFLDAVLLASAIIIWMLPLDLGVRVLLFAVLAFYSATILWRFALLQAKLSVLGFKKLEGKRWQVTLGSGVKEGVLRGDSTVTNFVSVLRFDLHGMRRPVTAMVFRDSLSADDYRRMVGVIRM